MRISDWSSDVCSSDLIQDFKSAARRKRIRAEHGHALIGDKPVEALLVFAKVFPKLLCQPGRVSGHSHARVTSGGYASEFPLPAGCPSLAIKRAALEKPVGSRRDLSPGIRTLSNTVRPRVFITIF